MREEKAGGRLGPLNLIGRALALACFRRLDEAFEGGFYGLRRPISRAA